MKTSAKLLSFIFAAFLFTACNKNKDEITISGRIFDPDLNKYVSGAVVKLSGNGIQSGVYTPGYSEIERMTTSEDGSFSFTLKKSTHDGFRLTVTKDNYFTQTHDFSASVFYEASEYEKEVLFRPSGTLEIHLYNAYPSDEDDKVVFYFSNADLTCSGCCINSPLTGNGPAFDTTFSCKFYGNQNVLFLRSVTKNQHTNLFFDSLFCPAFSTATYHIEY